MFKLPEITENSQATATKSNVVLLVERYQKLPNRVRGSTVIVKQAGHTSDACVKCSVHYGIC